MSLFTPLETKWISQLWSFSHTNIQIKLLFSVMQSHLQGNSKWWSHFYSPNRASIIVAAFPVYDLNHRLDIARDLLFVAKELTYENVSPTSPLWNTIATSQLCLMGQGLASTAPILSSSQELLQYNNQVNVSAIISLSPTMQNGLGLQEAAFYSISPALVFGASNDCVHPTLLNAVPAYNAIRRTPRTCKTYVEILNATSCSVTDAYQTSCLSDEIACGTRTMISATKQRSIIASLIASWVAGVVGKQAIESSNFVNQLRLQTSNTLAYLQSCPSLNSSHIMSLSRAKNIWKHSSNSEMGCRWVFAHDFLESPTNYCRRIQSSRTTTIYNMELAC